MMATTPSHSETPTAITSLPVEILIEILWLSVMDLLGLPDVFMLHQIRLVCHYWRSVMETSKSCSGFELCPCRMCRNHFEEAITSHPSDGFIDLYVGQVGLTSHPVFPGTAGDVIRDMLLPQIHRIQSVTIHSVSDRYPSRHFPYVLLGLLTGAGVPIPQLKSVRAANPSQGYVAIWTPILGDSCIPVRTLDLKGIYAPIECPLFRNMLNLSIELPPRAGYRYPTMQSLLDLLESSPEIQIIKLVNVGIYLQDGDPPTPRTIEVPHLQSITVAGLDFKTLKYMLHYISVPAKTSISIIINHIRSRSDSDSEHESLITSLNSLLAEDCIADRMRRTWKLDMSAKSQDRSDHLNLNCQQTGYEDSPLYLGLKINRIEVGPWFQLLKALVNSIPRLLRLKLDLKPLDSSNQTNQWYELLGNPHLSALETLLIRTGDAQDSLSQAFPASTASFLPSLQCLGMLAPISDSSKDACLRFSAERKLEVIHPQPVSMYLNDREYVESLERYTSTMHILENRWRKSVVLGD